MESGPGSAPIAAKICSRKGFVTRIFTPWRSSGVWIGLFAVMWRAPREPMPTMRTLRWLASFSLTSSPSGPVQTRKPCASSS